jgi:catechol 2,3-dioxygenase-like lactoylglutathione lyase family enzyme
MNNEKNDSRSEAIPKIGSVLETALYVADLDRSVAFYKRVLGFTLAPGHSDRLCTLNITPSQVLLLFRKRGSLEATVTAYGTIPPTDGDGSLHVTFFIPGSQFIIWQDHLRRVEVEIESVVNWPAGGRSIYFRDPDNHALELKTSRWGGRELESEYEQSGVSL